MNHTPIGSAQPVTNTVKRAMEFLKDRPMPTPKPKANARQNIGYGRPATKAATRSPAPEARDEHTNDNAQQQSDHDD